MGKFMRKCKGLTEIAVMEVSSQSHQVSGVITRARMRTLAMAEAKRKRQDDDNDDQQLNCHSRSRRKILPTVSPCCSSSSIGSQKSQNRSVVDLQDIHTFENSQTQYRERKEITLSSESNNMDYSTGKTEEEDSLHKSTVKMPSEFELEEFFSEAESVLKKQFADKYNFDIEKDVPLEGKYEWMAMKI